jgi:hypothetical protein
MKKKIKQEWEVNAIPSVLLVTNYNPKKIKVKITYDENYKMWRVNVK